LRVALLLACATPVRAQVYEPALIPPQINGAPTTMTPLNLGDDNTARVSLGFDFTYWGQTFTDAWVSSNGFVSFESAANLCCNGEPLDRAQRNTIYGYWSDLISYTGNPYYRRDDSSILFGWYGTNEYGTNNSSTFEIGLFSDGKIQLNYGNLGFSGWRDFTAGITGPNPEDNIPLFYGRNAQYLQNQSGILSWVAPTPVATVDCNLTPMDPSCPPANIDTIPDPVAAIEEAVEQSVDLTSEQIEEVRETATDALEQAQEISEVAVAVDQVEEVAETEEVATIVDAPEDDAETNVREVDTVERLDPDQVAALAATGTDATERSESEQSAAMDVDEPEVVEKSDQVDVLNADDLDAAQQSEISQDDAVEATVGDITEQSEQANTFEVIESGAAERMELDQAFVLNLANSDVIEQSESEQESTLIANIPDVTERVGPDQASALDITEPDVAERLEIDQASALDTIGPDVAERLEIDQNSTLDITGPDVAEQIELEQALVLITSEQNVVEQSETEQPATLSVTTPDIAERAESEQSSAMDSIGSEATERVEPEQAPSLAATVSEVTERVEVNQTPALAIADVVEQPELNQAPALAVANSEVKESTQQQESGVQEVQDTSSSNTFSAQARFESAFSESFVQGPSISSTQSVLPLDAAISVSSPVSMANTVEVLSLGPPPAASSNENTTQTESGMSEGQSETMSEIGAVPGFAAYTQASLQDRADFYAVRDIYRRRKLQDANFELYRLMQTNDARWQEMVDEQYK
jgi:hypothetical protein